jgi:DNA ligase-1
MKPMCAFRFQDQGKHLPPINYVQPKLNGVRCLHYNGICQSRWEKVWQAAKVHHITEALSSCNPNWIFDGELYIHGVSLQKINGAMSVNSSEVTPLTRSVEYHIYDGFNRSNPLQPFSERTRILQGIIGPLVGNSPIKLVDTQLVDHPSAEKLFDEYRRSGYEGMMYRIPDSPYGHLKLCTNQENRWRQLLKRKDFLDGEVRVIGITEGENKYTGLLGGLVCLFDNGQHFTVGSGFSDQERAIFYENPPIDQFITIRYEMLSDNGTPLKATYNGLYER